MLRARSVALQCARASVATAGRPQSAAATGRTNVVRRFAENATSSVQNAATGLVTGVEVPTAQGAESVFGLQGTSADAQV